ncbi:CxC2 domain-containing protein [Mycena indigotica]|uniref:CxC2 domain-containing protein n=1 Tax=Mycena indigotica TaxID=2126181 RepID=A0A8H6TE70_9AGAR|nr:CxC2 domain-containing protein [Mycena indigotica]KAF7315825.1 CxC2 domain-containing protein [Mycena indigotica]
MDAWYKDPTSNASPFVIVGGQEDGPSERQIVDELKKAEVEEARAGHAPLLEGTKTVVAFIKAGLQLQHIQRKIQATLKSKTLTADRASQVQELRVSFLKQLRSFQHLQLTYMPGIETLREADDAKRDVNEPECQPEYIKLYLPSDLTAEQRRSITLSRVIETEARVRCGQCADALVTLRTRLYRNAYDMVS